MNISQRVVILSAELSTNTPSENHTYTTLLHNILSREGFTFNVAQGCYFDSLEQSFVVVVKNDAEINELKSLAFDVLEQESILLQDSSRRAELIYNTGKVESLGILTQVSESVAINSMCYTKMNNLYYKTV